MESPPAIDAPAASPDAVDRVVGEWRAVRPDLDAAPLELVGRVLILAERLNARVGAALAPFNLSLGQFDILATLRRQPGERLSPGGLLTHMVLTSGGMTSRLDKLEALGLVVRTADPGDRRGVVVALTARGRKLIDRATAARLGEAAAALPELTRDEREALLGLLRRWLAAV